MARQVREKSEPEIVTNLRLLEMAYGGETVARIEQPTVQEELLSPPVPNLAEQAIYNPTLDNAAEESDFQPVQEPVITAVPLVAAGSSQVVFVSGGLPGEVVDVRLFRKKKSYLRANVVRVIQPATQRREAPCPYFGTDKWPNCGGCQWQHASYEAQLAFKHDILRDQFIRLGGFIDREPPLLAPLAALSPWGYRNNVEFVLDERTGQTSFHRQNSIRLVPVESCHIAHPLITLAIAPVTAALNKHLRGRVHQISLRVGPVSGDAAISAEEITALAAYSNNSAGRLAALERFTAVSPLETALQRPRPAMLMILRMLKQWERADLQPFLEELQVELDRYLELTVIGEGRKRRLESLGGAPYLLETLNGLTYHIPPLAFFQSNSPMAVELIDEVMAAFEQSGLELKKARLLDIYCGVGTFALQLAACGARVVGIEEYDGAVAGADENARLNGLQARCEFIAAKAEENILQLEERHEHFDAALVDPPRRGCAPALLQSLLQTRPRVLVYVSCDPSTLARDVKILSEGYELVRSRAVDMFPQTYHMESVSLLVARH